MSDSFAAQIRDAYQAYRRAVAEYVHAKLGIDSARAAGRIKDTREELARLVAKVPGLSMPPRFVTSRHHKDAKQDWVLWDYAVQDWGEVELEARLAAAPPRQERGGGTRKHSREAVNVIRLKGDTWRVRYGDAGEAGNFKDQKGSALYHLARLLAEPGRRFCALEFYPPPPDKLPKNTGTPKLPHLGQDEGSDAETMKNYEKDMRRLVNELKEAEADHDTELAAKLRADFDRLREHVETDKGRGRGRRKLCGTPGPEKKADQTLRMGLRNLTERFRNKGLPKLADHLDKCLDNGGCEWWYVQPPDTSLWHVSLPKRTAEE